MARIFNTVGPRQIGQYGMVIPRFVEAALAEEPLYVYGDGKQTRCFCHVQDVTRAIYKLANMPAAYGQIFNVGSTEEISILDLAKKIIKLTQSRSKIEFISYKDAYGQHFDDMKRRKPSIKKIEEYIDYHPSFSLHEILESVISHHKENL